MSERKVINKYFPPDFDPSKIPRRKLGKDLQQVVRLMAPCTMCCLTCNEFIYKGKKFNAKKETAQGEEYYGIKIFRFYIKCTRCSSEITFKTDPKNADYVIEHGATRNYEGWKEEMPNAAADDDEDEEDADDPMAALEASQAASKQQMENEDNLADLRQRNARMARSEVDAEAILAQQHALSAAEAELQRQAQEEEDEEVKRHFYKVPLLGAGGAASSAKTSALDEKRKSKTSKGAMGALGGYGSDSDGSDSESEDGSGGESPATAATVTVKRHVGATLDAQPTVKDLLAAKGIVLGAPAAPKPLPGLSMMTGTTASGVKRKDLASTLGIKIAKKKKV